MKTKLVKKIGNKKNKINQKILFQSKIHSISRIFLSSLLVVSLFYVAPLLINFTEKRLANICQKQFLDHCYSFLKKFSSYDMLEVKEARTNE